MKSLLLQGLILSALLSTATQTFSQVNADPFTMAVKLMKMETEHENAWFEMSKASKAKKLDLMIKHNNEKNALKTKMFEEIKKNSFSPELLLKYTKECLTMHRKHHEDWRNLMKNKTQEAQALDKKQIEELDAFEQEAFPEEAKKKEENKTPAAD